MTNREERLGDLADVQIVQPAARAGTPAANRRVNEGVRRLELLRPFNDHYAACGGRRNQATSQEPEQVGAGSFVRYRDGGIVYRNPDGVMALVYGGIGRRYTELGGPTSWLGFPVTDELDLGDGSGRVSVFEHGQIYWWRDTGPIEMADIAVHYRGVHCFSPTDGPGSDQIYCVLGRAVGGSSADVVSQTYRDVEEGTTCPDAVELYRGKPADLVLHVSIFERDQGDPNAYRAQVAQSVQTAADGLQTAGAVGGPWGVIFGAAGAVVVALKDVITDFINDLLGAEDDLIGSETLTLSLKDVVLTTRQPPLSYGGIGYKRETGLLVGDGGNYKAYFDIFPG
jgi:hypothetical protein